MRKNVYLTVSVLVGTSFILDSLWQPDNNKVLHPFVQQPDDLLKTFSPMPVTASAICFNISIRL